MLMAGYDLRDIAPLTRRINDYFATNAFRMKGDRVDLAMPNAMRLSLRTPESRFDEARKFNLHSNVNINVSDEMAGVLGGKVQNANFATFRTRGDQMLLSGANAELYHHALGTFDLDDKGIPMMTTFKDSAGNDRLAFMTYRQPTGVEEKIFMQADLSDSETLRTIMQKSSGDYESLINDPRAAMGLSSSERQTLEQVRKVFGGEDVKNLKSENVEKLIIKLRNEHGANYGFATLMQIQQKDLDTLAFTQSASTLGTNKMMAHVKSGAISHAEYMRDFGETAGKHSPRYSHSRFIDVLRESGETTYKELVVEEYNKQMASQAGYKPLSTMQEILDYAKAQGERSVAAITKSTVVDMIQTKMQEKALPTVENTIGVYINRQSFSNAMAYQVQEVLDNELAGETVAYTIGGKTELIPLSDYIKMEYSALNISSSEAVDVAKTSNVPEKMLGFKDGVPGKTMLERAMKADRYAEIQARFDAALGHLVAIGDIRINEIATNKAIQEFFQEFGLDADVSLSAIGKHILLQTQGSVGFTRARQIARQVRETGTVDVGSLIGFDPALVGGGEYNRLNKNDLPRVMETYIHDAERARDSLSSDVERAAVQSHIDEISAIKDHEEAIKVLTLKEGTSAYQKWAGTSALRTMGRDVYDQFKAMEILMRRQASLKVNPLAATPIAEHMEVASALVESVKPHLEKLQALANLELDSSGEVLKRVIANDVSTSLYQGISAAAQGAPAGFNIFDLTQTIQSEIERGFGNTVASSAMSGDVNIEGAEDAMLQLHRDDLERRMQTRYLRGSNEESIDYVQARYEQVSGKSGTSIAEVSADEAKDYIKRMNELIEEKGHKFVEGFDQDLYDFFRFRHNNNKLNVVESTEKGSRGLEAASIIHARETLARIEDQYGTAAAGHILPPEAIPEGAKRLVRTATEEADGITSVTKGTYTRIQDAMKSTAVREAIENPLIRKGAIGIVGLAAFGFIYSKIKDRSKDDMSGPPLLPGGSAYETDFPRSLPSISDLKFLNPTVAGMQYKINVMGSQQDIEKMQSLTQGVVDGPVDSTMYNSLPRLGKDPYHSVASQF